jgi:signal transduction histidine kinase
LLAAIPGFVLAYLAARSERQDDHEQAEKESELIIATASARYTSVLENTQVALETIAAIPSVALGTIFCQPQLQTIVERSVAYEEVIVARPDGSISCASSSAPQSDVGDQPWFDAATQSPGVAFTVDQSLVGSFAPRGSDDEPLLVLAARVSLAGLDSAFSRDDLAGGSDLVVLAPDNDVLYRKPAPRAGTTEADSEIAREVRARGGSDTVVADGADGIERIYAYRSLDQPEGAVLYAGIPTEVAYAGASERFRDRLIGLGLATTIALALAFTVAYVAIARRLRRLSSLTRRLGRGDLTARSNMRPDDDIGVLGHTIDAMASELQERDEERAHLLGAVVAAAEDERRRIASDVHDDSIQVMSAHVMGLQLLRRRVDDPELQARIHELEESGRAATTRLRELVFELHSPILEERGLASALDVLMERTFEGADVTFTLTSDPTDELPAPIRDTAYRVAQEALTNVRAHSNARTVSVVVRRDGDDLVLRVIDDGKGFVPSEIGARPGHLGLAAARERAAAVGGALVIDSVPGEGTTLVCRLPWSLDGALHR